MLLGCWSRSGDAGVGGRGVGAGVGSGVAGVGAAGGSWSRCLDQV